MKKKKSILFLLIGLMFVLIAGILLLNYINDGNNSNLKISKNDLKTSKSDLKMLGSYYDNASDFDAGVNSETLSELPKAYLEHITYEITELDEDKMVATLIVSVPDITDALPMFIDQIISDNQDMPYEEMLTAAKKGMEEVFDSEDLPKRDTTIQLSVEEREGSYKLMLNEEWNTVVVGSLENMYVDYLKILIGEMTNEMPK